MAVQYPTTTGYFNCHLTLLRKTTATFLFCWTVVSQNMFKTKWTIKMNLHNLTLRWQLSFITWWVWKCREVNEEVYAPRTE